MLQTTRYASADTSSFNVAIKKPDACLSSDIFWFKELSMMQAVPWPFSMPYCLCTPWKSCLEGLCLSWTLNVRREVELMFIQTNFPTFIVIPHKANPPDSFMHTHLSILVSPAVVSISSTKWYHNDDILFKVSHNGLISSSVNTSVYDLGLSLDLLNIIYNMHTTSSFISTE